MVGGGCCGLAQHKKNKTVIYIEADSVFSMEGV
jgi:hypothetical protein